MVEKKTAKTTKPATTAPDSAENTETTVESVGQPAHPAETITSDHTTAEAWCSTHDRPIYGDDVDCGGGDRTACVKVTNPAE